MGCLFGASRAPWRNKWMSEGFQWWFEVGRAHKSPRRKGRRNKQKSVFLPPNARNCNEAIVNKIVVDRFGNYSSLRSKSPKTVQKHIYVIRFCLFWGLVVGKGRKLHDWGAWESVWSIFVSFQNRFGYPWVHHFERKCNFWSVPFLEQVFETFFGACWVDSKWAEPLWWEGISRSSFPPPSHPRNCNEAVVKKVGVDWFGK